MSVARRAVLLVVTAMALPSCSLIADEAFRVRNHCSTDDDCSGAAFCESGSGMCVQDGVFDYTLYLQVAPVDDPTGAAIAPVALGPYVAVDGTLALVVPRQIRVLGTVRRGDVPIAAQITFAPHVDEGLAAAPLRPRPISTRTIPAGAELRSVDFATQLPARGSYDVTVEPLDTFRSEVPPFHQTMTVGSSDQALSIILPEASEERHIEGDLVDADGEPLVGFEVRAIDRTTGVAMSSIATTRATDEIPGAFSIALSGDAAAFDIEIRPTEERQGADLVPTYRVQPELLIAGITGRVQLLVPTTIAAVHWAGTVEAPAERGATPVANAVLQLHASDVVDDTTGVVGSVDLTLTTDAEGRYDGYVLPGHYSVAITPGGDAELAVLREERDLHPLEGQTEILGHVFSMPLRTVLGGSVRAPDGMPVSDATVRAASLGVPLEGLADPLVAQLARSSQGLTTVTGDFRLELDVGVYDLIVEPPLGSGFAWTVELGYSIGGSTAGLSDVLQIDAPVVVDADVTWLEGGEIAGAEIRAFAVTSSGRAVQVGRATSDAAGHTRILVPASIDETAASHRIRP
jgi:hypothetical protein